MSENKLWTAYPERLEAARRLRQARTSAENILWLNLKGKQRRGFKFRRQFPIGPYFADFCCFECRLVVEVDGPYHDQQTDEDSNRDAGLRDLGFRVMHFRNEDLKDNLPFVCRAIDEALTQASAPPPVGEGSGVGRKEERDDDHDTTRTI